MNKRILQLAIPNIISNITIPLLSMADLALLGHLESEKYIGAIALGGVIFSVIYWSFSFLRMGTSGFAAQAYGEKNFFESSNILARSIIVSSIAGIGLILLQWPIAYFSFGILNGSPEVKQLAEEYYYIRIFAAPASLSMYVLNGWFVGMQNSRSPMVVAIVINALNIIFNLLFVIGLEMKSAGVAYGTVLAQYSGLALSLFILRKYYWKVVKRAEWTKIFQLQELKRFFNVNADMFIRTLCVVFIISFFTNQSAAKNDTTLAVNTLLIQFFYLFSFFADGFAYAAEALVGKYIGANSEKELKLAIRHSFIWGVGIAIAVSFAYVVADQNILYLLTDNRKVIEASRPYLVWIWMIPITSFASFIWDGIYIGATSSKAMRNTMLISSLLVFFPSFFLLKGELGNHALWISLLLFLLMRGVLQSFLAKKTVLAAIQNKRPMPS